MILLIVLLFLIMISMVILLKTTQKPSTTIPRRLIQTWKSNIIVNPSHKRCQARLRALHPTFEYMFFDDADVDRFMKSTPWNEFFQTLRTRIQQIDFFRLCVLYYYGGIYYDMDMYPIQAIDAEFLNSSQFTLPVEYYLNRTQCTKYKRRHRYPGFRCEDSMTLGNYAMAAPPSNPEVLRLIRNIMKTYSSVPWNPQDPHVYVYVTTGPDKTTEMYYTDPQFRRNIRVLPPRLPGERRATFGGYAKHLETGTWK